MAIKIRGVRDWVRCLRLAVQRYPLYYARYFSHELFTRAGARSIRGIYIVTSLGKNIWGTI